MAFTQFLGFRNFGDEYKVMGLSAYGNPIYVDKIKKNLIKSLLYSYSGLIDCDLFCLIFLL